MAKRIIVADICSMVIDGNAVGHYFTVAQNYLDLFKSACNVKIAGGPVYKDKFKEEDLLWLDYNAESNCSSIENKRRELLEEYQKDTDICFTYKKKIALAWCF